MVSGVFFLQVHTSCNKTHFKAKKKYWVFHVLAVPKFIRELGRVSKF